MHNEHNPAMDKILTLNRFPDITFLESHQRNMMTRWYVCFMLLSMKKIDVTDPKFKAVSVVLIEKK